MIIDGGSTDGTVDIIRKYEDQIAYWVSEPDKGQAHAITKGIAVSTGEAIAYINSDDYYLPGAFQALAAPLMEDESVDWSVGACRYEHADGSLERIWRPALPPGSRRRIVDESWYVPQASSLWRRRVFSQLGGLRQDLHYVFDTEFTVRAALAGVWPTLLDQDIAVRYLHDSAKSAHPERFSEEWSEVQREFMAGLGKGALAEDLIFRVKRRARRHTRADERGR